MSETADHAALVASDPMGLRFPREVFIAPSGTVLFTAWFGGVRYVRADLVHKNPLRTAVTQADAGTTEGGPVSD